MHSFFHLPNVCLISCYLISSSGYRRLISVLKASAAAGMTKRDDKLRRRAGPSGGLVGQRVESVATHHQAIRLSKEWGRLVRNPAVS